MVRIRRLDRAYAARWSDRLLGLNADAAWDDWTEENVLADLPGKWESSLVAVDDEGAPLAYAIISIKETSTHLHHLVVAREHRRKGLGEVLVERWRAESLPARNRMTLKVHAQNHSAIRFYRRMGFSEWGDPGAEYVGFQSSNAPG